LFGGRFRRVRLRRVEKNRENEQDDFAKFKKTDAINQLLHVCRLGERGAASRILTYHVIELPPAALLSELLLRVSAAR
jgi:hypothetical protein